MSSLLIVLGKGFPSLNSELSCDLFEFLSKKPVDREDGVKVVVTLCLCPWSLKKGKRIQIHGTKRISFRGYFSGKFKKYIYSRIFF